MTRLYAAIRRYLDEISTALKDNRDVVLSVVAFYPVTVDTDDGYCRITSIVRDGETWDRCCYRAPIPFDLKITTEANGDISSVQIWPGEPDIRKAANLFLHAYDNRDPDAITEIPNLGMAYKECLRHHNNHSYGPDFEKNMWAQIQSEPLEEADLIAFSKHGEIWGPYWEIQVIPDGAGDLNLHIYVVDNDGGGRDFRIIRDADTGKAYTSEDDAVADFSFSAVNHANGQPSKPSYTLIPEGPHIRTVKVVHQGITWTIRATHHVNDLADSPENDDTVTLEVSADKSNATVVMRTPDHSYTASSQIQIRLRYDGSYYEYSNKREEQRIALGIAS